MHGTDFNTATSIYYVGYVIFQVPSNLILTRTRPSLYLSGAALLWGVIAAAQAGCKSYGGLVAARFFLGIAEAPTFPGCLFLMSCFYTRRELAHRFAWFFAGQQLANAFGGLIAAGIVGNLSGDMGLDAWQWLFVIEGVITIFIAFIAAAMLPDFPASTRFLSAEEKAYARWRLIDDTGDADSGGTMSALDGLKLALKDPRVYVFVLLQHVSNLSQTFTFFFPSIVKTLGYSNIDTLLITAPVWFATFLVSLLVTWTSGKYGNRTYHIMCLMLVAFVGNVIVTASTSTGARFFAMFLMPMGASSSFQIVVTFVSSSVPRPFEKRSAVVALASAVANCATIYGSYMYPIGDAPRYIAGGSATAVFSILVVALAGAIRLWHIKLNKKLAEKEVVGENGTVENLHADDPDARALGFRYIL